ncbi:hypothetical protein F8154_03615 [Alkaliphilus pronyensis]|uniref:Uncharacterized protein n=1 Tax=Alkaliphilus pronyensis TaxID=1482732 RepID=A0A6I0F4F4_9FIRM|nr:hypothetical protein F8154_03615 [Alkaliphilus pronyensis]
MKFFVLAADAQSGVISGSKEMGAIHNGMWALTLTSWRPALSCDKVGETYSFQKNNYSVACLEWVRWIRRSGFGKKGPLEKIIAT